MATSDHHGANHKLAEDAEFAGQTRQYCGIAQRESNVSVARDHLEQDCEDREGRVCIVGNAIAFGDGDAEHAEHDPPQVERKLVSSMSKEVAGAFLILIHRLIASVFTD